MGSVGTRALDGKSPDGRSGHAADTKQSFSVHLLRKRVHSQSFRTVTLVQAPPSIPMVWNDPGGTLTRRPKPPKARRRPPFGSEENCLFRSLATIDPIMTYRQPRSKGTAAVSRGGLCPCRVPCWTPCAQQRPWWHNRLLVLALGKKWFRAAAIRSAKLRGLGGQAATEALRRARKVSAVFAEKTQNTGAPRPGSHRLLPPGKGPVPGRAARGMVREATRLLCCRSRSSTSADGGQPAPIRVQLRGGALP